MTPRSTTPGPWEARIGGSALVQGDDGVFRPSGATLTPMVVRVWHDEQGRRCTAFLAECNSATEPNEANARLIASAPAMRDALEGLAGVVQYALATGALDLGQRDEAQGRLDEARTVLAQSGHGAREGGGA